MAKKGQKTPFFHFFQYFLLGIKDFDLKNGPLIGFYWTQGIPLAGDP